MTSLKDDPPGEDFTKNWTIAIKNKQPQKSTININYDCFKNGKSQANSFAKHIKGSSNMTSHNYGGFRTPPPPLSHLTACFT